MLRPTPAVPRFILLGKCRTQLVQITEQATWLNKKTPSVGSFFDLFHFDWLGS